MQDADALQDGHCRVGLVPRSGACGDSEKQARVPSQPVTPSLSSAGLARRLAWPQVMAFPSHEGPTGLRAGLIQPGLKQFQGLGIHSCSGLFWCVTLLTVEIFFLVPNANLPSIYGCDSAAITGTHSSEMALVLPQLLSAALDSRNSLSSARPTYHSWAAPSGHHFQLLGTGSLAPHGGPEAMGGLTAPTEQEDGETHQCTSQKQSAAEARPSSLSLRQVLIAAPVADAARWQLSSGKSLPLPERQVIQTGDQPGSLMA